MDSFRSELLKMFNLSESAIIDNQQQSKKLTLSDIEQLKSIVTLLVHFKYMLQFIKEHFLVDIGFKLNTVAPNFKSDFDFCDEKYNQLIDSSLFFQFIRKRENEYLNNQNNGYNQFKRDQFFADLQASTHSANPPLVLPNMDIDLEANLEHSQTSLSTNTDSCKFTLSQKKNNKSNDNVDKSREQKSRRKRDATNEKNRNVTMSKKTSSKRANITSKRESIYPSGSNPLSSSSSDAKKLKELNVDPTTSSQDPPPENEMLQVEYWCSFEGCRFKSKTLALVKEHEERRHVNRIIKCSQEGCDEMLDSKEELENHIAAIHCSSQSFRCSIEDCNLEFFTEFKLKQHFRDDHSDEYLTCKTCDKKFKTRKNLTSHIRRMHRNETINDDDFVTPVAANDNFGESQLTNNCTIDGCSQKFLKKSLLKQHLKESHRDVYITCKFCDKVCKSRNNLTNHIWIMHQEGDFKCPYENCDFRAQLKKELLNHKKLKHQRIRKCTYEGCGQMVPITRIRRHMTSMHNVKRYACSWPDCGKTFADHNALKNHVRIHLNFKRFKCKWPECGYASEQRHTVITHIRVCHFKLPRTKKKQMEMNITQDSVTQNPYDYLEACREDICI